MHKKRKAKGYVKDLFSLYRQLRKCPKCCVFGFLLVGKNHLEKDSTWEIVKEICQEENLVCSILLNSAIC